MYISRQIDSGTIDFALKLKMTNKSDMRMIHLTSLLWVKVS